MHSTIRDDDHPTLTISIPPVRRMEEPEYRVYIRVPIPRPEGFVDPPSFLWNAEKETTLWKVISRRTRGDINCSIPTPPIVPVAIGTPEMATAAAFILCLQEMLMVGTELAGVFQVDVPFLLQQAQLLYQKELIDLQLQMQRVNSSTSGLGGSKGSQRKDSYSLLLPGSAESQVASGNIEPPLIPRQIPAATPTRHSPSPLGPSRPSRIPIFMKTDIARGSAPPSPLPIQSSFRQRIGSTSSPLVPDLHGHEDSSTSTSSKKSNSSAAALRLYQQLQEPSPEQEEEEEPAFLPLTRPTTANKSPSGKESDSFSDLSDASISKSMLEEALEEHIRKGGSVAGSQMPGVRSIWKRS
jgi:hypothetical protein